MSDEPAPRPERRAALRVPAGSLRAELVVPRASEVLYLSTGGMMVLLDFQPPMGSEHRFTLHFPDRTIDVTGAVRNAEPTPDSPGEFRVGVEFLGLAAADHAYLESFVAERLR
jgi:hypothetical protein